MKKKSYPLIIIAVAFFVLMLIAPLIQVIYSSISEGFDEYINAITTDNVFSALRLTVIAMVFAVAVNTFFGIWAAWLLTKYDFRGKSALSAAIDIPFSVSPVIAGLSFIMMFGRTGWAAPIVNKINSLLGTDISLVFSVPGVILATVFVTLPYVSRELVPVLISQGRDEEEAAAMMGAGTFTIFRKVTLPHMKWPLLYGMVMCAARAAGEFGAVYAVSKTRGKTFTLPLEIDALYLSGSSSSITAAFAVSSILVAIALVMLVLKNIIRSVK